MVNLHYFIFFWPIYGPCVWRLKGRQTEGKSHGTKPLRIKAAPLLTLSRLRSTTRSIFKHRIQCSVFPLRSASTRYHTAWIKMPLKPTARAAHTNKHANTQLGLRNPRGRLLACTCPQPRYVCVCVYWKHDQRGHYWRQLDWGAAAQELGVCLSPPLALFFFNLSHLSNTISPHPQQSSISSRSAQSLAFHHCLQSFSSHHCSSGCKIRSSESFRVTATLQNIRLKEMISSSFFLNGHTCFSSLTTHYVYSTFCWLWFNVIQVLIWRTFKEATGFYSLSHTINIILYIDLNSSIFLVLLYVSLRSFFVCVTLHFNAVKLCQLKKIKQSECSLCGFMQLCVSTSHCKWHVSTAFRWRRHSAWHQSDCPHQRVEQPDFLCSVLCSFPIQSTLIHRRIESPSVQDCEFRVPPLVGRQLSLSLSSLCVLLPSRTITVEYR